MSKIKTVLFWLSAMSVGIFFGVKHEMESRALFSVQCFIITPRGVVPTIQFEDVGVREKNSVVKGKTKLYHLGDHEACSITEK